MINLSKVAFHFLALVACLPIAGLALADSSDFAQCRQFFAGDAPPVIQQPDMKPRALCFDGFAVLHSGKSHTPIYVAERLNRTTFEKMVLRSNHFYEEARLPRSERATLADYSGSGFDRGHMAPAADMDTDQAMAQSFSLGNMVPQAPNNNRNAWARIEKDTRKYVMRARGNIFVITGPVFDEHHETIGYSKVWVPRYLFKLVHDPATHRAWAFWIENTDEASAGKPISYHELVRRTGIDFIPNFIEDQLLVFQR